MAPLPQRDVRGGDGRARQVVRERDGVAGADSGAGQQAQRERVLALVGIAVHAVWIEHVRSWCAYTGERRAVRNSGRVRRGVGVHGVAGQSQAVAVAAGQNPALSGILAPVRGPLQRA